MADAGGFKWFDAPDISIDRDGPNVPFRAFDPSAGPEIPVLAHIVAQAAATPDKIAVKDDSVALTYRELLAEANALAAAISAVVPSAQPVGIRLQDTIHGPVALLACLAAATPAVLLDRADPLDRLTSLSSTSRLAAIISDEEIPGQRCIKPSGHAAVPFSPRPLVQDAPAFVVWTSGSSGTPKGIVHSQRSVLHRAGLLVNAGHLGAADEYLSLNTPASMGALLNAIAVWLAGATLHRVNVAKLGLARVLRRAREERITVLMGVPSIYRTICRLAGAGGSLSSVRLLSSNGEALMTADLDLLRACLPPNCHIQMVYGATETQAGMRFVGTDEKPARAQVPAGRPIPGTQFALRREDGTAAEAGESGELIIRSRYTAIGEWQDGRCVDGRLRPDAEAGWRHYAMGDLVRLIEDGTFVVIGRADRQMKLNGHRIEPVEVEAVLRTDPDALDAAVLPISGEMGIDLVAFIAAAPITHEALKARLQDLIISRMPPHLRPRRLHMLPTLPLLSGNKIDVAALRRLDAAALAAP